jgi:integrase
MRGTGVILEDARVADERGPQTGPIRPRRSLRFLSPRSREPPGSHAHGQRHAYDADADAACAGKRRHARGDATVRMRGNPGRSARACGSDGSEIKIWDAFPQLIPLRLHRPGMPSQIPRSPRQYITAMLRALLSFLTRGGTPVKYVPTFAEDRWDVVREFVVSAVAEAAASIAQPADRLIVIAAPFVDWVVNVNGYPAKTAVVFHPVIIRRYITRTDVTWSDTTRRTYRSSLMRMSEVLVGEVPLKFAPTTPQNTAAPYDDLDLHLLESWATGQSTAARRRSAGVVLALCTGAGLKANELLQTRRRDILADAGGVLVTVNPGARTVPLLARFETLLLNSIAEVEPEHWVFGSPKRVKHGISTLTTFLYDTDRGNEPDPVTTRMRNTWLITHLIAGTNMRALMTAAGVTKFEHLDQLVAHVPAPDTASYRRQLRAEVAR